MPRLVLLLLTGALVLTTQAQPLTLIVNADQGEHAISRHVYGHFAEHLGRGIYDGFWTQGATGDWHLRNDVIEALRAIRIPNLRWPGGCFADVYHWRDGVGPRAERPTIVNTLWGGITEDNSFGTHEFLDLAARLGAEPFVVGNVGSGTVQEMAQWWEYLNHPGPSPMADLRARHGHAPPFNVRFWGVGNESWGCGGNMRPEYYADLYRRFATFLPTYGAVRPFRVATGAAGDNYAWTEVMMREAGPMIDGLDLHHYTITGSWQTQKGRATVFTEAEWFELMQNALFTDELLTRHSTIMDRYDPEKRVWLIVGEWGTWHQHEPGTNPGFLYQQNTLRDALAAAVSLNLFNQHADRVKMANIAQTVNVLQAMILTEGDRMLLTPTYHVFELFTVHHDATLLPITLDAGRYTFEDASIPAVNASASRDSLGRVHLSLVNLDPHRARTLTVRVHDHSFETATGRILTAPEMHAHNTFDRPDAVRPAPFTGASRSSDGLTVELPAKSLVVLALE